MHILDAPEPAKLTVIVEEGGRRTTYFGFMGKVDIGMRWRTNPGRHPQHVGDLFVEGSPREPEELTLLMIDFLPDDKNVWFTVKIEELPDDLFEPAGPNSGKLRCKVCHRTGWPYPDAPWMLSCRAGHTFPCSHCDRVFHTRSALASHIKPRRKKAS